MDADTSCVCVSHLSGHIEGKKSIVAMKLFVSQFFSSSLGWGGVHRGKIKQKCEIGENWFLSLVENMVNTKCIFSIRYYQMRE